MPPASLPADAAMMPGPEGGQQRQQRATCGAALRGGCGGAPSASPTRPEPAARIVPPRDRQRRGRRPRDTIISRPPSAVLDTRLRSASTRRSGDLRRRRRRPSMTSSDRRARVATAKRRREIRRCRAGPRPSANTDQADDDSPSDESRAGRLAQSWRPEPRRSLVLGLLDDSRDRALRRRPRRCAGRSAAGRARGSDEHGAAAQRTASLGARSADRDRGQRPRRRSTRCG